MKRTAWLLVIILLLVATTAVFAADTSNVLGGGVAINEVLPDPTGPTYATDTDGNGTPAITDEFVELYNLSGSSIDISGWELWDAVAGNWFTFPGAVNSNTTVLAAGAYATVVNEVQAGGTVPPMDPGSISFDAGDGSNVLTNGGDNVILYDPDADQYIQITYNGDTADDPTSGSDYVGFSTTATLIGTAEDFGSDEDGASLTRYPSGDTNVGVHPIATPNGASASPTAITGSIFTATDGVSSVAPVALILLALLSAGALWYRRQTA